MNHKNLFSKIIIGFILGIILAVLVPEFASHLKILADIFIKLIKMLVAPIVFFTVVLGIASHSNTKELGKISLRTLIYFEITSIFALILGLIFVNIIQPGVGIEIPTINPIDIANYTTSTDKISLSAKILNIFPVSSLQPFVTNELLQVLFLAILFGISLILIDTESKNTITDILNKLSKVFFQILHIVIQFAPLAVCGAIAYSLTTYGLDTLYSFMKVILTVYITSIFFIFIVLGSICLLYKINIISLIKLIKEEIFITFGTTSSEAVLPSLMEKLIKNGHDKETVGLVIPTGYTFNLDGTAIYLSIAVMFIAQAYGIKLSLLDQFNVFLLLMLTSKGAAAVAGAGFIVLAATLSASNILPVEGLALLIGIDRFMSESRAVTNLIGNAVAAVVIDKSINKQNKALTI